MNMTIKTVGSILALSILAACGGGDGGSGAGSGGSGGGTGGGSGSGGGTLPKYTKQQMEWASHESAYTTLGVTEIAKLLGDAALDFTLVGKTSVTEDCARGGDDTRGTVTAAFPNAGLDHVLANGEFVTLDFENCKLRNYDMTLHGQVKITFSGISGDYRNLREKFAVTATMPLDKLLLDGSETLNGTLVFTRNLERKGTSTHEDDVETMKVSTAQLDISRSEGGKAYATKIKDYSTELHIENPADFTVFSSASYGMSGTDPVLGTYDHKISLTTPVRYENLDEIVIGSGAFKTVTPAETITTTFSTPGSGPQVKIESTSGLSSTMTYEQYDDL